MAGKTQGDLDTSAGKVVGGLDKSSVDDAADADTTGYDDSYSPSSSSYDDSSYGGGSSGSDGHGGTGTGQTDDATETPQDEADDTPEPDGDLDEDTSDDESPGGDVPDDEGSDDGETSTQPDDDNRTGNDDEQTGHEDDEQDGGGGDNDRPDGWVSIDIQAMTMLVAAMERARDQIPALQDEFRRILGDVELVDTSVPEADRLGQVTAWIDDELPGLRRRLAMAQELEGGDGNQRDRPDWRKPVEYDEGLVVDHQPHVSRERARTAASSLTTQPDGGVVDQLIAKLTGNQHDPYFAHELTTQTDPDTVATVIDDARAGSADPDKVDQLANLLQATVRTAARGTDELAPADGFEERWAQFTSAGDPAPVS